MGLFEIIVLVVGFYWYRAYKKEEKNIKIEDSKKKEVSLD